MGTLSKLRRLVLREGVSVREAAQRVGIARNTASRWLALGDMVEPRYRRRVPVETGNQSWRFRSSSAKTKGSKNIRTKSMKGVEEAAMPLDLSTNE